MPQISITLDGDRLYQYELLKDIAGPAGYPGRAATMLLDEIALMDRLGLTYRLHDLRHTYACRLAQAGINPVAAQRLLGHNDLKTTLRYYRLSETDILTQAARIDPL